MKEFLTHLFGYSWAVLACVMLGVILLGVASGNDRSD